MLSTSKKGYKGVTIADIAASAGVATSTVSRALSNSDLVSETTRAQIIEIAEKLDYKHSGLRHSLRVGTGNIAIVVPDISNPYFAKLVKGTHHSLSGAGFTQILIDSEESAQTELDTILKISPSVDGLILAASRLSDEELVEIASQKPVVALNRQVPDVTSVQIDSAGGASHAVEHLVSLGHKEILYVSGPETSWSNKRRWESILESCERFGITPSKTLAFNPSFEAGATAADSAMISRSSSAICFNDLLAIGMMQRLADRGVRVPEDFSVIGCDNSFGSEFCNPPLTTISSDTDKAGKSAVNALLALIEEDSSPGQVIKMPTHLKLRESTGLRGK